MSAVSALDGLGHGGGSRTDGLDPRASIRRAGFRFFQVRFEWVEEFVGPLRAPAEWLPVQFGDPQLERGNLCLLMRDFRL